MTIKSALNVCKEYAKDTFENVKHPVKSVKAHCGRFWNDMSKKEKALTMLKVVVAAAVLGAVGAVIGAAFGLITPVLTFTAIPYGAAGVIIGGVLAFVYLTRKKETNKCEVDIRVKITEENVPDFQGELQGALNEQRKKVEEQAA